MQFCKILLLGLVAFSTLSQEYDDKEIEEIIKLGQSNEEQYVGSTDAKQIVDLLKKNKVVLEKKEQQSLTTLKKVDLLTGSSETNFGKGEELFEALASVDQQQLTEKAMRYEGVEAFILVSFSMPKTSLETLFAEVGYQYADKNIVFVFQGWQPPNFNAFMNRINHHLPDGNEPNVVVDPTVFNKLEVDEVPFFAIKTEQNVWKRVVGDVGYSTAYEEANSHYDTFAPIGKTYPIAEPNILDYIHAKIASTDWEKQINTATNRLISEKAVMVDLLPAERSYKYSVDGSITVNKDIEVNGQNIANQGDVINPLDFIVLSKSYAVIDVDSSTQLNILRYWKQTHARPIRLIAIKMPAFDRKAELESEFGSIGHLNPLLAKRFGLEKIPSLVSQDDKTLIVEVVKHDQIINIKKDLL
jgi:type-F conjugative transfer system pilin assembly protein TrbC